MIAIKKIEWETEKEALDLNCTFCVCSVLPVSSGAVNLENESSVSETENNEIVIWKPIRKVFFGFFVFFPDTLENFPEILQRMLPIHYLLQILSGNSLTLHYDLHWKTHHLFLFSLTLSHLHICPTCLILFAQPCTHLHSPPLFFLSLHLHSFAMYCPVLGAYAKPYIEYVSCTSKQLTTQPFISLPTKHRCILNIVSL